MNEIVSPLNMSFMSGATAVLKISSCSVEGSNTKSQVKDLSVPTTTQRRQETKRKKKMKGQTTPLTVHWPEVFRCRPGTVTHLWFSGYKGKAHLTALANLFGNQRATSQCHSYRNSLHLFSHDPTSAPSLTEKKKRGLLMNLSGLAAVGERPPQSRPSAGGGGWVTDLGVGEAAPSLSRVAAAGGSISLGFGHHKTARQPDTLKTAKCPLKWKLPAKASTKTHSPRVPGKAVPKVSPSLSKLNVPSRVFPLPCPNRIFNRQVSNWPWRRQPIGTQTSGQRCTHVGLRKRFRKGWACAPHVDPAPGDPSQHLLPVLRLIWR